MLSVVGRVVASGLGLVLAAGFVVASGAMNYAFLSRQASSAWEGQILGAVAIGVTGYNALGLMFVSWAWENGRRKFFVPAGLAMWVVFLGFSLLCAVGFAASHRGAVTGSRESQWASLTSAKDDLKKLDEKLVAAARPARAAAVVEEALNEIKQDRRWLSTKGCTEATLDASRDYCRTYFQTRQELQHAVEHARLEKQRDAANQEVLRLKGAGASLEADPQASIIVRLSRGVLELSEVQLWLNAWVALVIEMGAALLPYLATGHGFGGGRRMLEKSNARRAVGAGSHARKTPPNIRQLELAPDGTWQVQE